MLKKLLIIVSIITFFFLIPVKTAAVVPQAMYDLISTWNTSVENLENKWEQRDDRNSDIAKSLYLTESDLSSQNRTKNNSYIINLFENRAGWEIELNIDYREDKNKMQIYVLNMQESRDTFIKTNFYAAHAGEVLIYTMANNDRRAQSLVEELRIYDFWGDNANEIKAYDYLESNDYSRFYVSNIGEFNLYFDLNEDDFPDTFDIGYTNL